MRLRELMTTLTPSHSPTNTEWPIPTRRTICLCLSYTLHLYFSVNLGNLTLTVLVLHFVYIVYISSNSHKCMCWGINCEKIHLMKLTFDIWSRCMSGARLGGVQMESSWRRNFVDIFKTMWATVYIRKLDNSRPIIFQLCWYSRLTHQTHSSLINSHEGTIIPHFRSNQSTFCPYSFNP